MSELTASQARLWALELNRITRELSSVDWKEIEKRRTAVAAQYPHRTHPIVDSKTRERIGAELWFTDGSRAGLYYSKPGVIHFDESLMKRGARVEDVGPTQHDKLSIIVVEERKK